jgi:DNA polymerase
LNLITHDYESFWSATHDIKKCGGPVRYIAHPDTEIQSCAIKFNDEPTFVVFGEDEIRKAHASLPVNKSMLVAHNNSGFDAVISTLRFGLRPQAWGCTAAMARPIYAKTVGVSLRAVAEVLGLGQKLSLEATNTKGKRLADFTPQEIEDMTEYNKVDTDLCYAIFKTLAPLIGKKELKTIDYTIRMFAQPKFTCDIQLLTYTLEQVQKEKAETLASITRQFGAASPEDMKKLLASAPKFAKVLEELGVDVPLKISKTTGKETFALAKTDQGLLYLQEHSDARVQAVVAARLDVKSTILETRMQSFIGNTIRSKIPMPVSYCGADTTGRWSGFIFNPQNLPRIGKDPKHSDALRKSLRAPAGNKVVVADLSGVELRVNHFLWKVQSSMDLYRADPEKADLYKDFASSLYDVPFHEVTKNQRAIGKVSHLGLGFGAGAAAFQRVAKLMGGVDITLDESKKIVDKWREQYRDIVAGWKSFDSAIISIASGEERPIDSDGLCTTYKGMVRLPSGRFIRYPHLRRDSNEEGRQQWYYGEGRHKATLYGGKGVENLVQAIARDIMNDINLKFIKETGNYPALLVHDETVLISPEDKAEEHLRILQDIMRSPPDWWKDIVLWSEGDIADCYGDAK